MTSINEEDLRSAVETPFMKQIDKLTIKNLHYPLTKSTLSHIGTKASTFEQRRHTVSEMRRKKQSTPLSYMNTA